MLLVGLILLAFLLGSIPTGYIIGRFYGKDVRRHGSGNIGATNVGRILGRRAGITTLIFDILKGMCGVFLARFAEVDSSWDELIGALLGVAVVYGHCFSPFLRFRGGKGVAPGFGVFLVLAPASALTALLVFALVAGGSGYVSLGSLVSVVAMPFFISLGFPWSEGPLPRSPWSWTFAGAVLISALVLVRHSGNIERLWRGTEPSWRRQRRERQVEACSSASGTK